MVQVGNAVASSPPRNAAERSTIRVAAADLLLQITSGAAIRRSAGSVRPNAKGPRLLGYVSVVRYCTFADTEAVPVIVNVHVFVFLPLEQAPDQIASRPFVTLSVIDAPVVNDADPELPVATLMPAGLEVTRSPSLPLAVTVSVEG